MTKTDHSENDPQSDINRWLVQYHKDEVNPEYLHLKFIELINRTGIKIHRSSLWLPTAHPELWGTQLIWSESNGIQSFRRDHSITQTQTYLNTPGEYMHAKRQPVRWRLAKGEGLDMPMLKEIADAGGTDYLIVPFHTDHQSEQPWITFSTDNTNGFTSQEVNQLIEYCGPLSWKIRVAIAELATRSLLSVYLGDHAAQRVLNGEFKRGTGVRTEAVIWFCDMRGFTQLGNRCSSEELVNLLDRYFEVMSAPIKANGGEILKFIGDAILAIFPIQHTGDLTSEKAVTAAEQALSDLAEWNATQENLSTDIKAGIALHRGDVLYGNIGGSDRLDFTVIGNAVNLTSRIESLCKRLAPLLITEDIASLISTPTVHMGNHSLRGVQETVNLFTLPAYLEP